MDLVMVVFRFFARLSREVHAYRFFLMNFIKYELKLRFKSTFLGTAWVFLSPLLYFVVLSFVFSFVIRGGIENFKLFFLSGLVPWMMLNNTILTQVASVVNNGELIKKISIPRFAFPLASNIARMVDNLVFLALLFTLFLLFGGTLSIHHLWVIPLMALIFLTTFGIGFLLSLINVFVRDTEQVVSIGFQILFFLCPIIYPLRLIPEKLRIFFLLNPFYYYVEVFHQLFYYQVAPSLKFIGYIAAFSLGVVALALAVYGLVEKKIVFYLSI